MAYHVVCRNGSVQVQYNNALMSSICRQVGGGAYQSGGDNVASANAAALKPPAAATYKQALRSATTREPRGTAGR